MADTIVYGVSAIILRLKKAPGRLKKVAMFLASGDPDMYDGAKFSYDGDFLGYLGLEDMGIFTNHDICFP